VHAGTSMDWGRWRRPIGGPRGERTVTSGWGAQCMRALVGLTGRVGLAGPAHDGNKNSEIHFFNFQST
jgi:hypothetical protein